MKETTPSQSPAGPGFPGPAVRWLMTLAGLVLLALAGFANWTGDWFFAAHWKVYVRFPGMGVKEFFFFPVFYVLVGLPILTAAPGLFSARFRRALVAPWRSRETAVPFALTLLFFLLTMFPWEFSTTPIWETGSKMVLYLVLGGCGFALLMAGFLDKLRFLDRPMRGLYDWLLALPKWRFMLLLFGVTFALTNLLSWAVFEHLPHIQDSISQVFQARIFATGRFYLDSPRFPDFFDYTHIINNGHWYSQYPFMHSLLILPFVFLGMPWLTNPLLGALTVPLVYVLGRDLHGEKTGRMAGALACLTPFVLNMSSEFMNGASALFFTTLFLIFFFRTLDRGRWRDAVLTGLFIGCTVNVRPLTALAVAAPFVLYGLYRAVREPGRLVPRFLIAVLVAAAVSSLTLLYNQLTNGAPLLFGYVVKWGAGHELGFGKSGWGAVHTPFRGLVNTGNDMNLVNKYLFEWPIPALLPLLGLFAVGIRDRRDWLLLALFLSLSAAYFFYWFHNVCFGPRFLYEASPALLILTVRGAERLGYLLRRTFGLEVSDERAGRFVGRAWPVLTLVMLVAGIGPLEKTYHTYAGVSRSTERTVERAGLKNAVVFLYHFGHGFSLNRLDLQGDVVYAKDHGFLNSALTVAYPDREYWYANEDTLRRLEDITYPRSRLRRALAEMGAFLDDSLTMDYRSVIWPLIDLPVTGRDGRPLSWPGGPELTDYRLVSRELFAGRRQFEDYLPCLACWVIGDDREHLRLFSFMDDLQNFLAAEYKFTLLRVTSDGTGAVYDIREASGEELLAPKQGQAPEFP